MNQSVKQLFFAWTGFQRRQVSMAAICGFETIFQPVRRSQGNIAKVFTYLNHAITMLQRLRIERPAVVWIQLPQVPLLWIALIYRWFFDRNAIIIADCHNAMFRPPWSKVPLGLSLLSKANIVIAHNSDVLKTAVQLGVDPSRLMVAEDPPANFPTALDLTLKIDLPRPWLVYPASFAPDEPIAELLAAARMSPAISILITGNLKNCRELQLITEAPSNVQFLDFLERSQFEALIMHCDAVVAFTRLTSVQLSVCGEAVGAEKPMLMSDTSTLRRQFPKGSVFVDSSSPERISEGIHELIRDYVRLENEIKSFHQQWRSEWVQTRARELADRINTI